MHNLKNSLKFKLLAFWRKSTPFIDQKCTYEKVPKKFGQGPPPLFGQNPKEQHFFLVRLSLSSTARPGRVPTEGERLTSPKVHRPRKLSEEEGTGTYSEQL